MQLHFSLYHVHKSQGNQASVTSHVPLFLPLHNILPLILLCRCAGSWASTSTMYRRKGNQASVTSHIYLYLCFFSPTTFSPSSSSSLSYLSYYTGVQCSFSSSSTISTEAKDFFHSCPFYYSFPSSRTRPGHKIRTEQNRILYKCVNILIPSINLLCLHKNLLLL